MKLSIRTRFFILLFLLSLLPIIAYRFALDIQSLLLKDQAIIQRQTVENLALILENRTDLWALQIQKGQPNHLPHLNLDNAALWIINRSGQTNYVVGNLPHTSNHQQNFNLFSYLGEHLIKLFSYLIPNSFPYPYPQSSTPEKTLIHFALKGATYQQYRLNKKGQPVSLMSATPLSINGHIIGAIVLEQNLNTLFGKTLSYFYHLIGLSTVIFLTALVGLLLYILSLSNRIIRLDNDVNQVFELGKQTLKAFPDSKRGINDDEISQLRHHIYQMLNQLESYEKYLKQLPKMLRHELHNPLNRLSMSLSLLEKYQGNSKPLQNAYRASEQLKKIINALSEASSIEESLAQHPPERYPIDEMLTAYFENLQETSFKEHLSVQCRLPHPTWVTGDGFMMEQLLDKLLSNAKDFKRPQTKIYVSCVIIHQETHSVIEIEIKNKGAPIPEKHLKNIFNGMTSIRPVNQDQEETHLGLGLYIAKLIAHYHRGSIEAFNNDAEGEVIFKVTLPISFSTS